jgi:hypothetical protein
MKQISIKIMTSYMRTIYRAKTIQDVSVIDCVHMEIKRGEYPFSHYGPLGIVTRVLTPSFHFRKTMSELFTVENESNRQYRRFNAEGTQLTVRLAAPPEEDGSDPVTHFLNSIVMPTPSFWVFLLYTIIQIISLQLWTSLGDHQALASS